MPGSDLATSGRMGLSDERLRQRRERRVVEHEGFACRGVMQKLPTVGATIEFEIFQDGKWPTQVIDDRCNRQPNRKCRNEMWWSKKQKASTKKSSK